MASEIKVDTIVNAGGDNDSGIDLATNDNIKFNIAGSQKAIIDSSGNVGIGTSSPTISNGRGLVIADATAARLKLCDTTTGEGASDGFQLGHSGGLAFIFNHENEPIQIGTNNAEKMRLDENGNLGVGVTSMVGSGRIYSSGSYSATTGLGANMVIESNGLISRSTSSQRYKNTIADASHGLAELMKLRAVTYKHNSNGDTTFGGLIAEEVRDAGLTEFVQYDDDGEPDALAYGNMVSLCIKAIQELKTELDNAKARITALESK